MKALAILTALAASPAMAQECIGTPDAYASLTNNYGEARTVMAMMPDGRIIEMWTNPDTGTWSLFVTAPQGISCAIGGGEGFEIYHPKPNA